MSLTYDTPEAAQKDKPYLDALTELLFQLADDDHLNGHRGSEWIGLGPHIEEDVAFASISQDTMGHAVMYYDMLEELGAGKSDELAQLRKPEDYRNATLVERENGAGHYRDNPDFDWAYAIIRNYIYGVFKKFRLDALEQSSYAPLAETAKKIKREQFYHLYHWEVWIDQLAHSTDEARERLNQAVAKTWTDLASLFDLGPKADQITGFGLLVSSETIKHRFMGKLKEKLDKAGLIWPGEPPAVPASGREGRHSDELLQALNEIGEVYRLDPAATW
ncbi:phenylacetate-CoA oxygenase subunit PaaC [Paenibacillus sp. MZ04-78.2]|uniref:1,2-phenylacetyl-CoA epoxidase subunit PaaC n=1 Tax=Paenibacillus sp. MZ04-78.2 TaxID=2962034 RepID=UPI0020B66828|nr:1,2-phenylacetyl-CoA epoxidase subunit PaaC [Paenibacillus sp. MZ04-78.2]MCP3772771.1 phenylacetate-CoA oxygenase subunit PaaC [Paenibacillus sp. MZ04-78.2]